MDPLRAPLSTAEIIAVGSELLGTSRLDTNSLFIAGRLAGIGVDLRAKSVVGDDRGTLASIFAQALSRVDLVVLTGGLGPTDDDMTRDVVAQVLERELSEDPSIVAAIERRFARRGLTMPANNRRQAMVPRGAKVLDNPNGTAPGLYIEHNDKVVILLPGPPREMQPMIAGLCEGLLGARAGAERSYTTSLFVTGRTESHLEEIVQPIYSRWVTETPAIQTTILAAPGQIELHLTTRATEAQAARARLDAARDELLAAVGDAVFSTEGLYLEEVVGRQLKNRGLTIAAAESCTGGLFISRLTDIPGSSAYVVGGTIAYSNDVKVQQLDVPADLLAAHGAVSEAVAVAMAEGVRRRQQADVGVGITGIAGPDGGTPQKPAGTVCIAVIGPDAVARVRTFSFPGGRAQVKFQATQSALDMVRKLL